MAGVEGRVALVTGAGRGISKATAELLAARGARVMAVARSEGELADLGLEFLHWPQQRVLRYEMRRSKSCEVLESLNPQPVPGGYARVVSWVITESPHGIVHAAAYAAGRARIALDGLDVKIGAITHPSPANPRANRGWEPIILSELSAMGIRM